MIGKSHKARGLSRLRWLARGVSETSGQHFHGALWSLKKTVENRKRKWVYWGVRTAKKEIPLRIRVSLFSEFRMMTWLANPSLERER